MVKIEIHGHADEVRAEMVGLLGINLRNEIPTLPASTHTQTASSPKETKKAEKSEPKAEPKAEPKTETKAEPAAEGKAEPAAEGKAEPTVETIRGTVSKLMVKIGREKTVALLGEFGAKKGGELKEADYPKFLEKANAALA